MVTISGSVLVAAGVTVTAPAYYQLSTDNSSWTASGGSLTYTPTSGTLATSNLYIRYVPTGAETSVAKQITLTSLFASNKTITVTGTASVAGPTIALGSTSATFNTNAGTTSASQSCSISGSALTADITVTAPAFYQVSKDGSSWSATGGTVTYTQSGGSVSGTLYYRYVPTAAESSVARTISASSTGATSQNITVTGTAQSVITISPTSASFTASVGSNSAAQTFTVSGSYLTANITATAPANYQVSTDGTSWSATAGSVTFTQTGGNVNGTLYVRYSPSDGESAVVRNLTLTSTNATNPSVALTGTASKSITVQFNNNTGIWSNVNLYVFASTGYNPSGLNSFPGLAMTSIGNNWWTYTFSINSSSCSIIFSGSGSPSQTVDITGVTGSACYVTNGQSGGKYTVTTTTCPPIISVSPSSATFTTAVNTTSSVQSFSVSGSNLTANITATAPTYHQVSSDNISWSASGGTVTYTQSGGSVTGTLYVRYAPTVIESAVARTVSLASTGATTQTISLTSTATGSGTPSAQPTNLQFTSVTAAAMTVGWTAASPSCDGYVVLQTSGVTAPNTNPSDSVSYISGNTIGNATVVYAGSGTSVVLSGLLDNTQYNYKIYSYNGSGATTQYLTTSPLSGNQSTSSVSAPTANAGSSIAGTSFVASWSSVTGAVSYRLDVSLSNTFATFVTGYNNLTVSGTSQTVSGLTASTPYYYRVRAVGSNSTSSNSSTITVNTTSPIVSNAVTGDWNSTSSWVGGVVPTGTQDVQIVNGAIITRSSGITQSGNIVVDQGGTLIVTSPITTNGSVNINGTFRIAGSLSGGGTPAVNGSGTWTYGAASTLEFNSSGMFNIDGTSELSWPSTNGPFNVSLLSGGLQLNNNLSRTINGTFLVSGTNSLYKNGTGTYTVNGTLQINSGGLFANAVVTYGSNATLKFNTGGTVSSMTGQWVTGTGGPGVALPANVQVSGNTVLTIPNSASYTAKGNLTIDAGSTVNTPSANALTVSGNIVNNGTLTLGSSANGDLNVGGNWTNAGTFTHNSRTVTFNGTSTQTITKSGGETFGHLIINKSSGNLQPGSDITVAGNFTVTSGNVQNASNAAKTITMTGSSAALSVAAAGSITGIDIGSGNDINLVYNSNGGTLTVSGAATIFKFFNATVSQTNSTLALSRGIEVKFGTFTVNGTLQINAGGFVSNATNAVAPTYGASSKLLYNANAVYGRGIEWSSTSGAGKPNHVQLSNNTTLNYPNTGNSGADAFATDLSISGNLTIDAGSSLYMDYGGGTNKSGSLSVAGSVTVNGNMSLGSSTGGDLYIGGDYIIGASSVPINNSRSIYFNGSSAQAITKTGGGIVYFDYLRIDNSAANVSLSSGTNVTINTTSGNVLSINNTGALDLNGQTLTLAGVGGNIDVNASGRTITSSVSGAIIDITANTASLAKSITGTGSLIVGNNVTIRTSAGIDFGSSKTTVNGTLRLLANGFVSTNAPNYGSSSTLYYNSGNYTSSLEWASGTTAGAGVPQNVTVDLSATNNTLTLSADRTVPGTLTLTKGVIVTGANTVTVNAIAGGSANSYVNGNLAATNIAAGTTTVNLPIGAGSVYAPSSVTINGVSGAVTLTAKVTNGNPTSGSGIDQTKKSNHYWTITKSGAGSFTSYAASFDVTNTTNTGTVANYKIRKYDGSWSGTTSSVVGNIVSATGLNSFSDFEIGEMLTYTVTYDNNGGSGTQTDPSSPYTHGNNVTVLGAGSMSKTGYSFANWNTAANGSGTSYAVSSTITSISSNVTLYAQWAINNYSVIYDGNGNTGGTAPTTQSGNYNSSITLNGVGTLTKTGYTFNGWNTASNGTGTSYAGGASFTVPASNTTLYAQWSINSYNVSYDGNGNTGGTAPTTQSGNYNSSITLNGVGTLTKTGYSFNGWNTASDGSGTSYAGGASFTVPASNTTLYAQWDCVGYTWTGAVDNDFNNSGNWQCGVVPPTGTGADVSVSAGETLPLSSSVTLGDITLGAGSSINLQGFHLTLSGSVNGTLLLSGSTNSSLTFSGSGNPTVNFTSGTGSLSQLNVLSDLVLGSTLAVYTKVTVGSGATLTTNDLLTLKSSITSTAYVGQSAGTITGNVGVERYIRQNTSRGWRMLAVPIQSSQSIKASWQEGATSYVDNPRPGYGTRITANTATAVADGYDAQTFGNSLLSYNAGPTPTWSGVTSNLSTTNIATTGGWMIYIRGDRTVDTAQTITAPSATILETKGTLYQGDQTVNTVNGFNIVGNLYASEVDFTQLSRDAVNNTFYLWDPKLAGSYGLGGFQTFSAPDWLPTPGGGSYGSAANTKIQSGLAFLVYSNGAGSVGFSESAKTTGSNGSATGFRPSLADSYLSTNLYAVTSGTPSLADGNRVFFDASFSNDLDSYDNEKAAGFGEGIGMLRSSKVLQTERRQPVVDGDYIAYNLSGLKSTTGTFKYRLEFAPVTMNTGTIKAFLEDAYLKTSKAIDLSTTNSVDFTVVSSNAATYANRFKLVFRETGTVPVRFTSVKATQVSQSVKVEWSVSNEQGISRYEVERSSNGSSFTKLGTTGSTSSVNYSYMDNSPLMGVNYYRVRSIGENGSSSYTYIVKVVNGKVVSSITITGNVIKGGMVGLQFNNQIKGDYVVKVLNTVGQELHKSRISHTGGNAGYSVTIPGVVKGLYHVDVQTPDNEHKVFKVVVE